MGDSPVAQILQGQDEGPLGKVYGGIESVYDTFGLMSGDGAEAKRFIFGNLVGSGIVFAAKPSFAFTASGEPRPWALLNPQAPTKTALPWWMPGLAFGFFSGFMV